MLFNTKAGDLPQDHPIYSASVVHSFSHAGCETIETTIKTYPEHFFFIAETFLAFVCIKGIGTSGGLLDFSEWDDARIFNKTEKLERRQFLKK